MTLEAARRQLGLSYLDVWIDYFALGGNLDAAQLADYLRGGRDVSDTEHNVVTHALNEFFQARGDDPPRAPTGPCVTVAAARRIPRWPCVTAGRRHRGEIRLACPVEEFAER